MNIPANNTEPRSAADTLADICLLQQRLATATRVLLRTHGWRHTCLNPAHVWLWSKRFPDGRTLLTDLHTALAIEASLAHYPPAPAPATAPPLVPPLRSRRRQLRVSNGGPLRPNS